MSRVLTCVYCGREYPQDTPAHGDKILTDHIAVCEKHPMRKVVRERDVLRAALAGLVGVDDGGELIEMAAAISALPASADDKEAMVAGVKALMLTSAHAELRSAVA
jgi:hypothetical protein